MQSAPRPPCAHLPQPKCRPRIQVVCVSMEPEAGDRPHPNVRTLEDGWWRRDVAVRGDRSFPAFPPSCPRGLEFLS